MRICKKIKFLIERKKVILVCGEGRETAKEAILKVLEKKFQVEKELIVEAVKNEEIEDFEFFLKKSPLAVLVVTHTGDIPPEDVAFAGEKEKVKNIVKVAQKLPPLVRLVLNYDDETTREIDDLTNLHCITFGLDEKANIFATNIKFNRGMNFKVSFEGSLVPFWLEGVFGKEQIYAALAAVTVGKIFGMNLVEISQNLKDYKSLPGKMRLIEGIKGCFILDDAESATVFSMSEAIEILGRIPGFFRRIAVLGDVVGIGKYTIEAHEAIGERVARNADFLFTFGSRAKFIVKGALEKGMEEDKIFSFEKLEDGIDKLKETIRGGDLILVDGSKEMKMSKIVDEIRKIW
jgi:UDP-N-acetylmuramoyl-tripeptide--D-alanyl-D-alanine ligase